jgi:hypothetical protein
MAVVGDGYGYLIFVLCLIQFRVPCGVAYLAMCYGDKVLSHLGGVSCSYRGLLAYEIEFCLLPH